MPVNAFRWVIRSGARLLVAIGLALALCGPAAASHLVTGNGFGFAVVAPEVGAATKFYPHPHSFTAPDPANPLSEGIETANFITALGYGQPGQPRTADYVDDSHIIRMHSAAGSADYFMPFGLGRPALIISLEAATPWRVEWNRPIASRRRLNSGAALLRVDGIAEPLLLIPLAPFRKAPTDQPLAASQAWALIALEDESE